MNEILVKIPDEQMKALKRCLTTNKLCGTFLPEFDEAQALALFVIGAIETGKKEIEIFKVPEKKGGY
jgi:hypothetical protein